MSNISVTIDQHQYEIELRKQPAFHNTYTAVVNGEEFTVYLPEHPDPAHLEWVVVGNRPYEITLDPDLHWIESYRGRHRLELRNQDAADTRPVSADGRIKAPIPGLITRVMVEPGQAVDVGQPLLILEAMKMENEIRAPRAGNVQQLNVSPGQTVTLNTLLVEIG